MDTLPLWIQSKILGHLDLPDQQRVLLRGVCSTWQQLLDSAHPVHLRLKNGIHNLYDAMCPLAIEKGLTRKGYSIHLIDLLREFTMNRTMTPHVKTATLIGHFATYNLRAVLDSCPNLETLILNLVSNHWSKQTLRPESPSRPLTHNNLKTLRIDLDSMGEPPLQWSFVQERRFLYYLSSEFLFPVLETMTFAHRDERTQSFMTHGIPASFLPEEYERLPAPGNLFGGRFVGGRRHRGPRLVFAFPFGGQKVIRDPGLFVLPPQEVQMDESQEGQGQQRPSTPFLQFLSTTPNLKVLFLGNIHQHFFQMISGEENDGLAQEAFLTQLEEVTIHPTVLTSPFTETERQDYLTGRMSGKRMRTCHLELRQIPRFLRTLTSLKSLELSFGIHEGQLNILTQVISRNQNTLESLNITFALIHVTFKPIGGNVYRGSVGTPPLDLGLFSKLVKCTSLILTLTNQDETLSRNGCHDSLVNTSLLPQSLRVFKTNLAFSLENLTGLAAGTLKNLEVLEIDEYIGMRGEGHVRIPAPLLRDLLNNNPNMMICTIQISTDYPMLSMGPSTSTTRSPPFHHPREPRVDAYPTGQ